MRAATLVSLGPSNIRIGVVGPARRSGDGGVSSGEELSFSGSGQLLGFLGGAGVSKGRAEIRSMPSSGWSSGLDSSGLSSAVTSSVPSLGGVMGWMANASVSVLSAVGTRALGAGLSVLGGDGTPAGGGRRRRGGGGGGRGARHGAGEVSGEGSLESTNVPCDGCADKLKRLRDPGDSLCEGMGAVACADALHAGDAGSSLSGVPILAVFFSTPTGHGCS